MRFAWIRIVSTLVIVCALLCARKARAEADTFNLGDGHSGTQTYSGGQINTYAKVTAVNAGKTVLTITSVAGTAFAAGDLVLVWQTAGATGTSGSQTAIALAGTTVGAWELGRASAAT